MLGSPGTGPVGISFSGVSGVTITVPCSTFTVTVGMPVAVAVTLLGISWPETILQPDGASGVTATL